MNLKYMKLIKWEDDSTIIPRDSSHFSYFDEFYNVIPLQEQELWEQDWIGLRHLHDHHKLELITIKGDHMDFTPTFVEDLVIPVLMAN